MSDHHFCPRCGGHIKGERCELCAPDPADRELDASEIHDVSPAADGSLLKQVTTAGEDAGPQQLATPSPLCDVEARVRTLRPKQSAPRATSRRGAAARSRPPTTCRRRSARGSRPCASARSRR